MPPPQSKAWSYFKRDVESKNVKCKLCNLEMTYTGGTSNMLNHLKLKHSSDAPYEETELSLYKRERCDPNVNPLNIPDCQCLRVSISVFPEHPYRLSAYSQPQDYSSIN